MAVTGMVDSWRRLSSETTSSPEPEVDVVIVQFWPSTMPMEREQNGDQSLLATAPQNRRLPGRIR